MKEHGHFTIDRVRQILLFAGKGPWNDDTLRKGSRETSENIAAINTTKPWAQLSLLYGDSLMIPSAYRIFCKRSKERKTLGLSCLAVVIKDSEIAPLIKSQLIEAYEDAKIEYQFFSGIEEAVVWLRSKSFEISDEEITSFLNTVSFAR